MLMCLLSKMCLRLKMLPPLSRPHPMNKRHSNPALQQYRHIDYPVAEVL
jgi:hypothetical protein